VEKKKREGLDFIVDKLTNSIELVATSESFGTIVTRIFWLERMQIKNKEWQFKWHEELKLHDHEVYKLTTSDKLRTWSHFRVNVLLTGDTKDLWLLMLRQCS
jgi:hypothetical protein